MINVLGSIECYHVLSIVATLASCPMPHATYCVGPIEGEEEELEEFYQQTFPTINSASKSPFHMHNHKGGKINGKWSRIFFAAEKLEVVIQVTLSRSRSRCCSWRRSRRRRCCSHRCCLALTQQLEPLYINGCWNWMNGQSTVDSWGTCLI